MPFPSSQLVRCPSKLLSRWGLLIILSGFLEKAISNHAEILSANTNLLDVVYQVLLAHHQDWLQMFLCLSDFLPSQSVVTANICFPLLEFVSTGWGPSSATTYSYHFYWFLVTTVDLTNHLLHVVRLICIVPKFDLSSIYPREYCFKKLLLIFVLFHFKFNYWAILCQILNFSYSWI